MLKMKTLSGLILSCVSLTCLIHGPRREGGHRHLYHMALTDQLVIDATTHGGRARFMNHSCEPNCRIENWVVGRERRIGVFSARAIGEDEELTIDYQVRWSDETVTLQMITKHIILLNFSSHCNIFLFAFQKCLDIISIVM